MQGTRRSGEEGGRQLQFRIEMRIADETWCEGGFVASERHSKGNLSPSCPGPRQGLWVKLERPRVEGPYGLLKEA
jgi:hypothetical protein